MREFITDWFGTSRAVKLTMKKTGTVQAWNMSPKGYCEGFLLQSGKKISQINLHKDDRGTLTAIPQIGEKITVQVEPEDTHGEPAHEVFQMTEGFQHADGPRKFSAVITTLNYALHGEVNGGILDSGDFLHLKPEGARALAIHEGMLVEGHGDTKPMAGGHVVIEATMVNGEEVVRHHGKKKKHD